MASRSEQAKIRKMRSKGRYARFSGDTTKFAVRIEERLEHLDEEKVRIKQVEIYVGPASLSRQVVNGSKSSVNTERMESYFKNVRTKDQPLTIAEIFGVNNSKYQRVWDETPTTNRLCIYSNDLGRLDMYYYLDPVYHKSVYFFVEVDTIMQEIKRSREYGSPDRAKTAARNGTILWEEELSYSAP